MLIEPRKFLELTYKNGFNNGKFKQAMCEITANIVPIHVAAAQGKQFYFRWNDNEGSIDYILRSQKEIDESEKLHTEAFKLLKVIAD